MTKYLTNEMLSVEDRELYHWYTHHEYIGIFIFLKKQISRLLNILHFLFPFISIYEGNVRKSNQILINNILVRAIIYVITTK